MFKTFFTAFFFLFIFATADEVRPSYLEIKEQQTNHFSVLFKVPAKGDKKLSLEVKLPGNCKALNKKYTAFLAGAYIERWQILCKKGLTEKFITVQGLENTSTDLLLRLELNNGVSQTALLTPTEPAYEVQKEASLFQIVKTYTWLGITHILMGFDHLLFVFALLLVVKNMRRLLWTITAFTLAHSLTMAGATLGWVNMPQQPVEAMIALSILFLAMEIVHEKQGKVGLTSRYPWLIAFIFGLLHGFGFAGALAEIGLPQHAITLALVFFNVGVELGQLMFVSTMVLVALAIGRLKYPYTLQKVETVVVYAIGGLSSFWVFERLSGF